MAYVRHTGNGRIFIATPELLKLRNIELISNADAGAMLKNPALALKGLVKKEPDPVTPEAMPEVALAAASAARLAGLQELPDVTRMTEPELREFSMTYLARDWPANFGVMAIRNLVMAALMEAGKVPLKGDLAPKPPKDAA